MRQGPRQYHFGPNDRMPDLPPNPRIRRRRYWLALVLAITSVLTLFGFYNAGKFAIANNPQYLLWVIVAFTAAFLGIGGIAHYRRDGWLWLIMACMACSTLGLLLIYLGLVQ